MHHQAVPGGELDDQVFRAAADRQDSLPFQPRREVRRKRQPQVGAPQDHLLDPGACHGVAQEPADVFDFRELRHGGGYMMPMRRFLVMVCAVMMCAGVAADEGMWTFNNVPRDTIARKYHVTLTDQWLQHVQQSVVRLESGCTGSFVSADGLILTNHHCSAECLTDLSTAQRDLIAQGFVATTREQEVKCPGQEVSVLMATENVTPQVTKAIAGVPSAQVAAARNKTLTDLESQCEDAAAKRRAAQVRSGDAVPGRPVLAVQVQALRRHAAGVCPGGGDRRVRRRPGQLPVPALVPRHVAAARLRERQAGRHAEPPAHQLGRGRETGEPVFVAGHPGTTQRLLTVAQLKTQRDVCPAVLAAALLRAARPPDPVLEDLARGAAHREGVARRDRELASRSGACSSLRCSTIA